MNARFFVDENDLALGKALAATHAGVVFPGHPDLPEIPRRTPDDVWLPVIGQQGLICLGRTQSPTTGRTVTDESASVLRRQASAKPRISHSHPVTLHDSSKMQIVMVPMFVQRSAGDELAVKLIRYNKANPLGTADLELPLQEAAARQLHRALGEHLARMPPVVQWTVRRADGEDMFDEYGGMCSDDEAGALEHVDHEAAAHARIAWEDDWAGRSVVTGASLNGSCPRGRKMSMQVSALAISRTHRYGSR